MKMNLVVHKGSKKHDSIKEIKGKDQDPTPESVTSKLL